MDPAAQRLEGGGPGQGGGATTRLESRPSSRPKPRTTAALRDRLTPVPGYRVTLPQWASFQEVGMSEPGGVIRGPAPAFGGPVVCTLPVDQFAGRLDAFRREVSGHLQAMERPAPARPRLLLAAGPAPAPGRA